MRILQRYGLNGIKVFISTDEDRRCSVQPGDDAVRHRCMLYGCRPQHGFNLIWFYLISPWLERYLKQIIFVTITAEQSPTSVSARSAPLGACRHRINYIPPFLWNYLCPGPGSGTDNWNSWAAGLLYVAFNWEIFRILGVRCSLLWLCSQIALLLNHEDII